MMLKKALIGLSLLALSSVASAAFVVTDEVVTGDEMAGMQVTVSLLDVATSSISTTSTATWMATGSSSLATFCSPCILDQNGFKGEASVAGEWTLSQAGSTLGGFMGPGLTNPFGMWTLMNTSSTQNIVGFSVMGMGVNIAFDVIGSPEVTPGSNSGQLGFDPAVLTVATTSGQVDASFNDLFWNLNVMITNSLTDGQSLNFFADTDKLSQAVPAPASLAFVLAGLGLFSLRQSRRKTK